MSCSERSVQHHKRMTDRAIHRAYVQLAADAPLLESFHETLHLARKRAVRLFEAPIHKGRHLGVDALLHLSSFKTAHVRTLGAWAGTSASWRPAVSALAHHLICDYKVPSFLASCWYAADPAADKKRSWFIAHSRGASFRSLDLPIAMTRRMENYFLASQDDLLIEHAMRKAELHALEAPAELVKAVLSTRMATDLSDGNFWRTVWMFFVKNADEISTSQIAPMIDYIRAIRSHHRLDGMQKFSLPERDFSMKGRTVQSMLRLMQEWHQGLGSGNDSASWARSPFESMQIQEMGRDYLLPPRQWQMMELINSEQLRMEGSALHHCVASYAGRCYRGTSSIWSLRFLQEEKVHHVLTVEVNSSLRAVVQARGKANRAASGKPLQLLQDWAHRERLQLMI